MNFTLIQENKPGPVIYIGKQQGYVKNNPVAEMEMVECAIN